jgi:hypothetical protein
MSLTIAAVTFDCRDAAALAEFWSALLERPVDLGAKRLGDFDEGGFVWRWPTPKATCSTSPRTSDSRVGRRHHPLTEPPERFLELRRLEHLEVEAEPGQVKGQRVEVVGPCLQPAGLVVDSSHRGGGG